MAPDYGRGVDELVEMAESLPETAGLSTGLAAIRASAAGEGVTVTVDLNGMPVGLELDDSALSLGAGRLAGEITRLAAEASANALREGISAIVAVCGEELATVVRDQLGLDAEPEPAPSRRRPAPSTVDDDFGEVQSWALSP
jgi:hypothetical protein